MTDEQRHEAAEKKAELVGALDAAGDDQHRARSVILAKMILAAAGSALTEKAAAARAEAYRDALDDLPAWAIAEAVRRWNRGECGDHDYRWAPQPPILRRIVLGVVAPCREALAKVEAVLGAVSGDRAMDATPIERLPTGGASLGLAKMRPNLRIPFKRDSEVNDERP